MRCVAGGSAFVTYGAHAPAAHLIIYRGVPGNGSVIEVQHPVARMPSGADWVRDRCQAPGSPAPVPPHITAACTPRRPRPARREPSQWRQAKATSDLGRQLTAAPAPRPTWSTIFCPTRDRTDPLREFADHSVERSNHAGDHHDAGTTQTPSCCPPATDTRGILTALANYSPAGSPGGSVACSAASWRRASRSSAVVCAWVAAPAGSRVAASRRACAASGPRS